MTAIERTIYPHFTRTPSTKEVRTLYTPVLADRTFVEKHACGPAQKFSLMILLKVYQRLHYFLDLQTIPGPVIGHIRSEMKYPDDLVPDIASATLWRYYLAIREQVALRDQSKETRHTAAAAMQKAAQVMKCLRRAALRHQLLDNYAQRKASVLGSLLFSWTLFLLAGYGYRLRWCLLWPLGLVLAFAALYWWLDPVQVTWWSALGESVNVFHGRGAAPTIAELAHPVRFIMLSIIEALLGLLIETVFVATVLQRLFGK